MTMKFNSHFNDINESYLFAEVATRTQTYRAANPESDIIKLGIGDVTLPLAPAVVAAMRTAVSEMSEKATFRGYGPYEGYDFLRESIRGYYLTLGVEIAADEIFVSDGAKSDLGNILDIFSESGTSLITDPVYPVYVDTNLMAGRKVIFADATEQNGFLPAPDYGVKADLIYICSPNNPTGAIMEREDLEAIAEVIRKHDILVMSDEIYAELTYKEKHVSIIEIEGMRERTILINGFSKAYAMTGWRVGWCMADRPVKERMQVFHQYAVVSVPAFVQRACAAALETDTAPTAALFRKRRDDVYRRLTAMGLEAELPHGAFYFFLNIGKFGLGSEAFCEKMLREGLVGLLPGIYFGTEGYVRLSYCYSDEDLREGLDRMEAFLKTL